MTTDNPPLPNIVFILSDDQGPWAMGCAGNPEIRTPSLDRLAAEGVRFSNFFCTSPVCSPARASLLTGRIPSQHGVHDWIRAGNSPGDAVAYGDAVSEGADSDAIEYLAGQLGYTEILASHGYTCGLSGKWHLGDSFQPQKGYGHWYVHERGGGPYYGAPMIRDGQLEHDSGYVTDLITDDALAFLDRHAGDGRPFYLGVHYTAPHSPWIGNHPQAIVDSYDDCAFESCPQEPIHPWVDPAAFGDVWEHPREHLKGYFAAVTAMDLNIGRVLDRLDALGLAGDTLVIFSSDNGFNCGHHGVWGKGNGTFPQNMYDTSVKVPALFRHPGRIPAGAVTDALVSGYDFMPTLLDYVGLANPAAGSLPGRSFAGLFAGQQPGTTAGDEQVVVFDEYGPVRMMRTAEWKYVHRYPYGPHELYHLASDPDERRNLVADPHHVQQVEEMMTRLEEWFLRYVDPRLDGIHAPVTGKGQLDLAGHGVKAFADLII